MSRCLDARPWRGAAIAAIFAAALGCADFDTPIDPSGDRLFWIIKPKAGGGIWHMSTVVNEPGGLRESVLAETTRTPAVVQAWFMGANPALDDRAPAWMLREHPVGEVSPLVLAAARAFAGGADF